MKIRLIEEYDPIRDTTIWWTEKTICGLWLGILSVVEGSISSSHGEARARWERIKRNRAAGKTRKVIDRATL